MRLYDRLGEKQRTRVDEGVEAVVREAQSSVRRNLDQSQLLRLGNIFGGLLTITVEADATPLGILAQDILSYTIAKPAIFNPQY